MGTDKVVAPIALCPDRVNPIGPPWIRPSISGCGESLLRASFAEAAVNLALSETAHPFCVSVGQRGRLGYFGTPEEVRHLLDDTDCPPPDAYPTSQDEHNAPELHGDRSPFLLVDDDEPFHWSNTLLPEAVSGKAWLHVGNVAFGRVSSSDLGSWEASYDLHLGHRCTVRRRFPTQAAAREFVVHQASLADHDIREQIRTVLWDRRKHRHSPTGVVDVDTPVA